MEASPALSSSYLNADIGGRLIGVSVAFLMLDIAFVALREIGRRRTSSIYGWDDYLIAPALAANVVLCIHGIVMVRVAGVGYHVSAAIKADPDVLIKWAKCIYALEFLYLPAVALPKLSLLSLYLRIFVKRCFKMSTWAVVVLIILNWVAFLLASIFECWPVAYQWNKKIPGGHCFDVQLFYRMVNIPNLVTDVAMLALPIPMVWQLQTSKSRKAGLMVVFLTGSVGMIASCVRLAIFSNSDAFKDNTWRSVTLVAWSIIEPSMYLIAACLPNLRPLVSSLSPKKILSRFSDTAKSKTEEDFHLASKPGGHAGFTRLEAGLDIPSYHAAASTAEREPNYGPMQRENNLQPPRIASDLAIDVTTDIRVSSLSS
ncbi:MAG: hypothetical protein Q9203_003554 [Teloschistes exilis]